MPADHDLVAQRRGGGHWYRLLRFGHAGAGPYWVPAVALATAGGGPLPAVPEAPRRLTLWAVTHAWVVLAWRAPVRGGPVSGYRLWRRTGRTGPFTRVGPDLAATVRRHEDATVAAGTVYEYRVQALAAGAGAGPRTAALRVSGTTRSATLATAYVVAHDCPADAAGKGGGWHGLPHRDAALTRSGTTATVDGLARNAAGFLLPPCPSPRLPLGTWAGLALPTLDWQPSQDDQVAGIDTFATPSAGPATRTGGRGLGRARWRSGSAGG